MIYKQQLLPTTLAEFTRTDHKGKPYTPLLENVTFHKIHVKICNDSTLHQDLERRATIETMSRSPLTFPKGFSSYCTISNTVKAIGIGGVASVFVSCKSRTSTPKPRKHKPATWSPSPAVRAYASSSFPALTVLLLLLCIPLRTLCAFRHGMLALVPLPSTFPNWEPSSRKLTLPMEGTSSIFTAETWQIAHQISWYGTWHCLPLAIAVCYAKHTFYFTLSLRTGVVPSSNVHQLDASAFE